MAQRDVDGMRRTEGVAGDGGRRRVGTRAATGGGWPTATTHRGVAMLQAAVGNAATTLAVQRIGFRTTRLYFLTPAKPADALTADEKRAHQREIDAQRRWTAISVDVEAWTTGVPDAIQAAARVVRDGLQWLAAATVDDWDPSTLTAAQKRLGEVEEKLGILEAAVNERRREAKLKAKRAEAERQFREAVASLGPLLSLTREEASLLSPEDCDSLLKHRARVDKATSLEGDPARVAEYIQAAQAVAQSVKSTGVKLKGNIATVTRHRDDVQRIRVEIKDARDKIYDVLEVLEDAEEDGARLHQEAADVGKELAADQKANAPDPSNLRNELTSGWYALVRPRGNWIAEASKVLVAYQQAVTRQEPAWAASDTLDRSGLGGLLKDTNTLLRTGVQERQRLDNGRVALVVDKLEAKLKNYRHLRNPTATTAPTERRVVTGTAEPATVEHEGAKYRLLAPGTSLYGRLAAGGLDPKAGALFAAALDKGIIAAMGTGDSGVKVRGPETYELKVRRTILVANGLAAALRVRNSARPVSVNGRSLITFDQAGHGH